MAPGQKRHQTAAPPPIRESRIYSQSAVASNRHFGNGYAGRGQRRFTRSQNLSVPQSFRRPPAPRSISRTLDLRVVEVAGVVTTGHVRERLRDVGFGGVQEGRDVVLFGVGGRALRACQVAILRGVELGVVVIGQPPALQPYGGGGKGLLPALHTLVIDISARHRRGGDNSGDRD